MTEQDYIGKPLSECPDGTVAVVEDGDGDYQVAMLSLGTACYASLGTEAGYEHRDVCLKDKVVSVIKLGKPRPRTLGEEEAGVAWVKDIGTADEVAYWHDGWGGAICCFRYGLRSGIPTRSITKKGELRIGPDWTRLGKITGIVIDGKVYGKEATDE